MILQNYMKQILSVKQYEAKFANDVFLMFRMYAVRKKSI